jgi:hypothetical protein
MKKIACSIFLSLSVSLGANVPVARTASEKNDFLLIRAYSPIMASAWLLLFWVSAPEDVQEKFLQQVTPGALLVNFGTQYTLWLSATLCHEAGHALANHLLTNRSSTIHIGDPERVRGQKPLFAVGNIFVEGFNPLVGSTAYDNPGREKISAAKTGIISASGGMSGIMGHHALLLLWYVVSHIINNKSIDKNMFKKAFKPDQISMQHFLNLVWPLQPNSDAAQIWRECLGMPESVIESAVYIAPAVQTMLITGMNYYNNETTDAPLFSAFCLEMANYYLLGFLHFEA